MDTSVLEMGLTFLYILSPPPPPPPNHSAGPLRTEFVFIRTFLSWAARDVASHALALGFIPSYNAFLQHIAHRSDSPEVHWLI